MTTLTVAVFGLSYVLIASRRVAALPIGRPGGALLGAVLMVLVGALTTREALAAVDGHTLALLFGLMALSAYLERSGVFDRVGAAMRRLCGTPRALLVAVGLVPGVLSAVLLNDAVCLFLAPIVIDVCLRGRLPLPPYLIALATSANIGSAATLVGNPQNVIIGGLSGYGFVDFLVALGPATAAGLAVNAALLMAYYARSLPPRFADADTAEAPAPRALAGRPRLTLAVAAGVAISFFAGADLALATLAGVVAMMIIEREEPKEIFERIDWSILVFFASLFVVVAGLATTGLVDAAWAHARPYVSVDTWGGLAGLSVALAVASNLVSNVPVVLLVGPHLAALGDPDRAWALLAFVTTVAGNLTLVGSVANIIVAERAAPHHLGFVAHLRFGAVSTLLVLGVGVPLVIAMT
jgi:Na+/H+ antiporter NhaD/arsenite permease-like protein